MLDEFTKLLPKIELHAHLNGSVNLKSLSQSSNADEGLQSIRSRCGSQQSNFEHIFNRFAEVHATVNSLELLDKACISVVQDFADDNVKYLEIRSTPRSFTMANGEESTKREYIQTVINGLKKGVEMTDGAIIVMFLISVDRSQSVESAVENVDLAIEFSKCYGSVVGIDFSGNPLKNDARDFIAPLLKAKQAGLKVSVHLAETEEKVPLEAFEVLHSVVPDRIGHGTFLLREVISCEDSIAFVRSKKIPLELCLTSNVLSNVVNNYADHHFGPWFAENHPICICTDDMAVFETSLSEEIAIAAKTFNLSNKQLVVLTIRSIEFIFAPESVKVQLREILDDFMSKFKF